MTEADANVAADAVAHQLSGLFRELADGCPHSDVVAVSLVDAPASGRAERLYVFQCDSEDLQLVGTIRRSWETDAFGFRSFDRRSLTSEMVQSERWGVEMPYVRFATDGRHVRFGMRFGPSWYVAREGALEAGAFDPARLVDPYLPVG